MSNSTRQGGYDERLVVPLEASRRGAHRARTNPLVAALPLLAVIVVVAAVIGVAYTLFLKPNGDSSAIDPSTSPTAPAATSSPGRTTQPSTSASKSSSGSNSSSGSSPKATVDKTTAVSVYNATTIAGLAGRVTTALRGEGFSKAAVNKNSWHGSTVGETTVFYAKESQSATAAAIAKALGGAKARLSSEDAANGGIVVVAFSEPA